MFAICLTIGQRNNHLAVALIPPYGLLHKESTVLACGCTSRSFGALKLNSLTYPASRTADNKGTALCLLMVMLLCTRTQIRDQMSKQMYAVVLALTLLAAQAVNKCRAHALPGAQHLQAAGWHPGTAQS